MLQYFALLSHTQIHTHMHTQAQTKARTQTRTLSLLSRGPTSTYPCPSYKYTRILSQTHTHTRILSLTHIHTHLDLSPRPLHTDPLPPATPGRLLFESDIHLLMQQ